MASRIVGGSRSHEAAIWTSSGFRCRSCTQFCTQRMIQISEPTYRQVVTSHLLWFCKPQVQLLPAWAIGRLHFAPTSCQRMPIGVTLAIHDRSVFFLLRVPEPSRRLPSDARECLARYPVPTSFAPSMALSHRPTLPPTWGWLRTRFAYNLW